MQPIKTIAPCALALAILLLPALASADGGYVKLPAGSIRSALDYKDTSGVVRVAPFSLMRRPVTNAEFLDFVRTHPQWRRDRVASVFAEPRYLSHWNTAITLGTNALPKQPVTQVSWFAAQASCEARHARLPTWTEWEYAAAADETRRDARADPAWRERILGWYSRPSSAPLPTVGRERANVYGVQDLHGLIWEWVGDYSAMLVSSDNRTQGDADRLKFCGAGALSTNDRENYAVLMRVAMLSALEGHDTTVNLGFRCALDSTDSFR